MTAKLLPILCKTNYEIDELVNIPHVENIAKYLALKMK